MRIRKVPDGLYGANSATIGIDSEFFNADHTIASADLDSYTIPVTAGDVTGGTLANLTHDFVGGSGVVATRNITSDVMQLAVSQVKLLHRPYISLDRYGYRILKICCNIHF